MILGFTGTREGLRTITSNRLCVIIDVLRSLGLKEVHHGQCVGADELMHLIACDAQIPVVVHPPINRKLVFDLNDEKFTKNKVTVLKPYDYLARNKHIVAASDIVLGTPLNTEVKGGTWYTIEYAKEKGKKVIVLPDSIGKILI
jgi:hypothetical protein